MIHLREDLREAAIDAGWRAYAERVPGLESAYRKAAAGWGVCAVCDDNKVIGALLHKDGVIHIGIAPEGRGRWASKRVIKSMLAYGKRTTLEPWEDPSFIERIGFVRDGTVWRYKQ